MVEGVWGARRFAHQTVSHVVCAMDVVDGVEADP